MSIACRINGHRLSEQAVYNSGYYFTRCGRCSAALMRSAREEWHWPPSGHRIVWKNGRHSHSIEADYNGFLPTATGAMTLPALRNPFLSWSRNLVSAKARAGHAARPHRPIQEEVDDYDHPRLLFVAVLIGVGFRMVSQLILGR